MQRCSFRLLAAVSSPYAVSCNLHAAQTGLDVGRRKRSVGRQLFNHRLCCTAAGKLRLAYLGTPEVTLVAVCRCCVPKTFVRLRRLLNRYPLRSSAPYLKQLEAPKLPLR